MVNASDKILIPQPRTQQKIHHCVFTIIAVPGRDCLLPPSVSVFFSLRSCEAVRPCLAHNRHILSLPRHHDVGGVFVLEIEHNIYHENLRQRLFEERQKFGKLNRAVRISINVPKEAPLLLVREKNVQSNQCVLQLFLVHASVM